MAPLPSDNTTRYRVTYTGPFGTHTMLFHGAFEDTAETLRPMVADVIEAMKTACWGGTVFSTGEFALKDSHLFFLDAGWTPITTSGSAAPGTTDSPSQFMQYGGRDNPLGVRVKLYLFEVIYRGNAKMRLGYADTSDVSNVLDVLNSFDNTISTLSGDIPTWYNYANLGQNDYLTHKARS